MAQYLGAASEGTRALNLLKKREKQLQELEQIKQKIKEDTAVKSKFDDSGNKFTSHFDVVEEQLRTSTIGLMTLQEMKEKRELLIQEREKKLAADLSLDSKGDGTDSKKAGKRKQDEGKGTLSFDVEEEDGDDEEEERPKKEDSPPVFKKRRRLGKNPDVDTSFLPDRDREEEDKMERDRLRQEWLDQQELIKNEDIEITYSYWDGSGHRRTVRMKKGHTIYNFLQKSLENLRKEFPELRGISADSCMYIKEDLIIPHHYTFYDFIVNKARGKSGPLFAFDVHDDVRLLSDAAVEKDETHAGKVVLRGWYERNKHIFPASRWEPYDPEKKWEKYTIGDKKDQ